jgi:ubiquinone/menaquinone biosynthesis C-methylase UbiE
VLDVGCGTGELTLAIAAVGPAVDVSGVDPSSAYVRAAQPRVPAERVRFLAGDAQALQFSDATFDRTLSMLALNFVPDRQGHCARWSA